MHETRATRGSSHQHHPLPCHIHTQHAPRTQHTSCALPSAARAVFSAVWDAFLSVCRSWLAWPETHTSFLNVTRKHTQARTAMAEPCEAIQQSTVSCPILSYPILQLQHSIAQYRTVLHRTVQYSGVQCSTVRHGTARDSTVQCSTVQ